MMITKHKFSITTYPTLLQAVGYGNDKLLIPTWVESWSREMVDKLNHHAAFMEDFQKFAIWVGEHHPELLAAYTAHTEIKGRVSPPVV